MRGQHCSVNEGVNMSKPIYAADVTCHCPEGRFSGQHCEHGKVTKF